MCPILVIFQLIFVGQGYSQKYFNTNILLHCTFQLCSYMVFFIPIQGWRKRSGCSGFGLTSFSQCKNESPFLQIVSTEQKF